MYKICISTRNESPTNNDISSSDQAYTDIPPATPYPPSDNYNNNNNNNNNNGIAILSSTEEFQVVTATNHYYNDTLPMDHRTEFIPVAVLIESNVMNCI